MNKVTYELSNRSHWALAALVAVVIQLLWVLFACVLQGVAPVLYMLMVLYVVQTVAVFVAVGLTSAGIYSIGFWWFHLSMGLSPQCAVPEPESPFDFISASGAGVGTMVSFMMWNSWLPSDFIGSWLLFVLVCTLIVTWSASRLAAVIIYYSNPQRLRNPAHAS